MATYDDAGKKYFDDYDLELFQGMGVDTDKYTDEQLSAIMNEVQVKEVEEEETRESAEEEARRLARRTQVELERQQGITKFIYGSLR